MTWLRESLPQLKYAVSNQFTFWNLLRAFKFKFTVSLIQMGTDAFPAPEDQLAHIWLPDLANFWEWAQIHTV